MRARSLVRDLFVALASVCVASLLIVSYVAQGADASHEPANKTAVAGSTIVRIAEEAEAQPILQETMRVASPTDLMLQVQLECSLITNVKTVGDDDQHAEAKFDVWVTIDGVRVPVSAAAPANNEAGNTGDEGTVTFCNRRYQRIVSNLEEGNPPVDDDSDDDLTIETFLSTKSTHGFNWIALNTGRDGYDVDGNNILDIKVWADYTESESSPEQKAEAVIGNRTLIVEPDNFSVHEAVQPGPGAGN